MAPRLPLSPDQWLYAVSLLTGAGIFTVARNVMRGGTGRVIVAIRDNPVAAASLAPSAHADSLDYFRDQLKPYQSRPVFQAPGPAFDAKHCMAGKSIFSVPDNMSIPFVASIEKSMIPHGDAVARS